MLAVRGTYIGTGIAFSLDGFGGSPLFALVKGGSNIAAVRTSSMPGDLSKPASGSTALAAGLITSMDADGMSIGADARVNQNGVQYYWFALVDDGSGDVEVGSYVGTGIDNKLIPLSINPDLAMVFGEGATSAWWKCNLHSSVSSTLGTSATIDGAGSINLNRIQRLLAGSFEVGTSASVNAAAVTYYYMAARKVAGVFNTIQYVGDAVDGRTVTGAGFDPTVAFIQSIQSGLGTDMVFRGNHVGDSSSVVSASADAADRIQNFVTDGVELGTAIGVNQGNNYALLIFLAQGASQPAVEVLGMQFDVTTDRLYLLYSDSQVCYVANASTRVPAEWLLGFASLADTVAVDDASNLNKLALIPPQL